jgi:hypothetical protein
MAAQHCVGVLLSSMPGTWIQKGRERGCLDKEDEMDRMEAYRHIFDTIGRGK